MPTYDFRCDGCDIDAPDIWCQTMEQADNYLCPRCGEPMERQVVFNTSGFHSKGSNPKSGTKI